MSYFVSFTRFFSWILVLVLSIGGLIASSFYLYLTPNLPAAEQLKHTQLQIPLRIYSNDGLLIAEFGEKRRTPVDIDNVPEKFKNAFIAAEDNRYYSHRGVDIKGLMRASLQLITTGHIQSGGSTITMQVAKNFFLSREKTFTRKFNEIFLSLQIEQELTKDEILELYFNKIYLGNRAYGIEAAAKVYYGTSINNISLAQMAMIAGLPKAPSKYNPIANPGRALIRRNWILRRMKELEFITPGEYQEAIDTPITASYHGTKTELDAPYLAEMTRKKMIKQFGESAYEDGYEVYLTVNSKDQDAANQALRKGLEAYDQRHGYRGALTSLDKIILSDIGATTRKLQSLNQSPGFTVAAVTTINDDTKTITTIAETGDEIELNWEGLKWARSFITTNKIGPQPKKPSDIVKVGDAIYLQNTSTTPNTPQWKLSQIPTAQSALISLTPKSGAIRALVGGYNFYQSKYNRVIQSKRQPGSNFKPFIYLAALENGKTAASLINDAPIVFDDKNLENTWRPENSSGKFYGPTRLRRALYKSRNLVSIRLLKNTGIKKTLNYIENFGFDQKEFPKDLSLALGSAGVSPWDLARGYAIIANGGYKVTPYFIDSIKNSNGGTVFKASPLIGCYSCKPSIDQSSSANATPYNSTTTAPSIDSHPLDPNSPATLTTISEESADNLVPPLPLYAERVIDERSTYIMHSILKDVIRKGTGRRAKKLNRTDIAGKTGTTNDQKDAWFSGFNGDVVTTTWVGFDQPLTLGRREFGASAALPIWIDYMKAALDNTPSKEMPQPEGIVTVKINPETGKRASANDTNGIFEIFRTENAPEESSANNTNDDKASDTDDATLPEDIF